VHHSCVVASVFSLSGNSMCSRWDALTCCVPQHFGTKNNVLHERMALFSVLTPFEEKRQDDYQVTQQERSMQTAMRRSQRSRVGLLWRCMMMCDISDLSVSSAFLRIQQCLVLSLLQFQCFCCSG
jgi:hypothetical protein